MIADGLLYTICVVALVTAVCLFTLAWSPEREEDHG